MWPHKSKVQEYGSKRLGFKPTYIKETPFEIAFKPCFDTHRLLKGLGIVVLVGVGVMNVLITCGTYRESFEYVLLECE